MLDRGIHAITQMIHQKVQIEIDKICFHSKLSLILIITYYLEDYRCKKNRSNRFNFI